MSFKITYAIDVEKVAKATAKTMTGNFAELEGCGGMVLVRDGTPEAEERQKQFGVLMIPVEADSIRYWVCSR